ncbi:glycosyltransferase family 2 protein [Comamonas thiooxydans]|uniref:glycosyltransferase family 2 protein n=1 Tax=Comamonas thiooxydans TaxID=363952 RepID=UPI0006A93037|nr:glycosyltransferase family 2 protein [Comamonas thiooxydans]CUA91539.1 Glycosyl transferase family 2 [Comamonas thiooxydans]
MKISVITVSFNSEKTIERTINSVLTQDYVDYEYIIIDGESKDGTLEICQKYSNRISRIISEKDSGIYDAMNKGISLASGEIIAILNSDDYFANNQVLKTVSANFSPEIDLLLGNVEIFNESTNKVRRFYSSKIFNPKLSRFGIQPPHPAVFIRKSAYTKHGTYDKQLRIAADFDLLTRFLSVLKLKFKRIDKTLVLMSDGGISNGSLKSRHKVSYEIIKSLKKNNIYSNILFVNLRFAIKLSQFIKI